MDPHDRHFQPYRSHNDGDDHSSFENEIEPYHTHSSTGSSNKYALPEKLHSNSVSSSASTTGSGKLSDKGMMAIQEELDAGSQRPSRKGSRNTSRRGSLQSAHNSVKSGYSVRDIYGDMDEFGMDMARERTRETLMSRVSRVASRTAAGEYQSNVGDNLIDDDGEEYVDIDPELVSWDGPDDPENPRNWPLKKKCITTLIVALYTTISPMSSSIISPAIPKVAEAFGFADSQFLESLTVSIFVLAWAICPLFMAPMSELFGRKVVLDGSIVFLLIFNIACAVSKNTTQLMVFRFLAGMGGAPPLSVGAGVLADMFDDAHRNLPLAFYSLGPTLGPIIAPIISGWISEYADWRWVFWALVIINGSTFAGGCMLYQESYATTLLERKAKKLRKETGNMNLHTLSEVTRPSFGILLWNSVSRPIKMLARHPIVQGLGLFQAFIYGFMYLTLVCYPTLWSKYYGYKSGISGTLYLCPGVGAMLGLAFWTPVIQKTYLKSTMKNNGVSRPEYRIYWLSLSGVVLGIGLFWYGWSAQARLVWIMPGIGIGIFFCGIVLMFMCIQNYLIDMNPKFAASAVGAAAVFRSLFGFGFPLFGNAMYDKLDYGWANTLCGILCFVLGVPFPLFIYTYGERIRHWADTHVNKDPDAVKKLEEE